MKNRDELYQMKEEKRKQVVFWEKVVFIEKMDTLFEEFHFLSLNL